MSRDVRVVLLCEDDTHKQFVKKFLCAHREWSQRFLSRHIRVEMHQKGAGSAEQYVRKKYLEELASYRVRRSKQGNLRLIVMVDGDKEGGEARLRSFDRLCREKKVAPRGRDEKIAVFAPTWNIETWLAYLKGEEVDETRKDYPRSISPEDFVSRVEELAWMCRGNKLRQPVPPSLEAACKEFERLGY